MAKPQDTLIGNNEQFRTNEQLPRDDRQSLQSMSSSNQTPQQQSPEPKEMQRYSATRSVRAAKLKGVDKNPDGTVVLVPEDAAFAPVQLGGNEAANVKGFRPSDNTKDYGYVVIDDNGRREWMSTADFEALYPQK